MGTNSDFYGWNGYFQKFMKNRPLADSIFCPRKIGIGLNCWYQSFPMRKRGLYSLNSNSITKVSIAVILIIKIFMKMCWIIYAYYLHFRVIRTYFDYILAINYKSNIRIRIADNQRSFWLFSKKKVLWWRPSGRPLWHQSWWPSWPAIKKKV